MLKKLFELIIYFKSGIFKTLLYLLVAMLSISTALHMVLIKGVKLLTIKIV